MIKERIKQSRYTREKCQHLSYNPHSKSINNQDQNSNKRSQSKLHLFSIQDETSNDVSINHQVDKWNTEADLLETENDFIIYYNDCKNDILKQSNPNGTHRRIHPKKQLKKFKIKYEGQETIDQPKTSTNDQKISSKLKTQQNYYQKIQNDCIKIIPDLNCPEEHLQAPESLVQTNTKLKKQIACPPSLYSNRIEEKAFLQSLYGIKQNILQKEDNSSLQKKKKDFLKFLNDKDLLPKTSTNCDQQLKTEMDFQFDSQEQQQQSQPTHTDCQSPFIPFRLTENVRQQLQLQQQLKYKINKSTINVDNNSNKMNEYLEENNTLIRQNSQLIQSKIRNEDKQFYNLNSLVSSNKENQEFSQNLETIYNQNKKNLQIYKKPSRNIIHNPLNQSNLNDQVQQEIQNKQNEKIQQFKLRRYSHLPNEALSDLANSFKVTQKQSNCTKSILTETKFKNKYNNNTQIQSKIEVLEKENKEKTQPKQDFFDSHISFLTQFISNNQKINESISLKNRFEKKQNQENIQQIHSKTNNLYTSDNKTTASNYPYSQNHNSQFTDNSINISFLDNTLHNKYNLFQKNLPVIKNSQKQMLIDHLLSYGKEQKPQSQNHNNTQRFKKYIKDTSYIQQQMLQNMTNQF